MGKIENLLDSIESNFEEIISSIVLEEGRFVISVDQDGDLHYGFWGMNSYQIGEEIIFCKKCRGGLEDYDLYDSEESYDDYRYFSDSDESDEDILESPEYIQFLIEGIISDFRESNFLGEIEQELNLYF